VVKKVQEVMFKFVGVFALLVITFWGCKDQMNKTGYDVLLPGDLVSARKLTIAKSEIKAYTVTDDSLRTVPTMILFLGKQGPVSQPSYD
jgi:hypothetical protein